ncbi:hypothetical protein FJT64_020340 [Amphibalanus amphitrite]|uniref:Uncharacterized protein n=1 Tax=Amphibalanus amphitrite TaxID=1232801 RepID=A0A6A4X2C0_AMPAM|nr:hypothetical protein FJT64_020340 [Amphibalanus amphitrite]
MKRDPKTAAAAPKNAAPPPKKAAAAPKSPQPSGSESASESDPAFHFGKGYKVPEGAGSSSDTGDPCGSDQQAPLSQTERIRRCRVIKRALCRLGCPEEEEFCSYRRGTPAIGGPELLAALFPSSVCVGEASVYDLAAPLAAAALLFVAP